MQSFKIHSFLIYFGLISLVLSKKPEERPEWAKKDIRDFSDADMERLLDQWDEDEDPLPDDELPEHLRPAPKIDMSKFDTQNPEAILEMSKKGKTLMTFVNVANNPTRQETEELTTLWQGSLRNNHIQLERYVIDDNRVIFMFSDGSQAWDAKNFLLEQERCESVTIENKVYEGKNFKAKVPKSNKSGDEL